MKVNKNLRDLLMEQTETVMLSPIECDYFGTKYQFIPTTWKDIQKRQEIIIRLLETKKWWQFWK
jgi:hypothetical protein